MKLNGVDVFLALPSRRNMDLLILLGILAAEI